MKELNVAQKKSAELRAVDKLPETVPSGALLCRRLVEARVGDRCRIIGCKSEPKLRRRLIELGFCVGQEVEVLSISPLKNSFLVVVRGSVVAIRKSVASKLEVHTL